jgi:hypothetical protein
MMNLQEKSSSTDLKNIDFTFLPSDYMHAPIAAPKLFYLKKKIVSHSLPGLFSVIRRPERRKR